MTLELKHIIDPSGEWYRVGDGSNRRFFSVNDNGNNRDEKLKEATAWFDRIKKEAKEEILLSEEI